MAQISKRYFNLTIPILHDIHGRIRFRSRRTKSYVATKKLFSTKGRLFLKVLVTSYITSGKRLRKRKVFSTTEYTSAEESNMAKNLVRAGRTAIARAIYGHLRKGGKSNPEVKILDYIIKYPLMYDKNAKVSKYNLLTKDDENRVLVNKKFREGKELFRIDSRIPKSYINPDVLRDVSFNVAKEYEDVVRQESFNNPLDEKFGF